MKAIVVTLAFSVLTVGCAHRSPAPEQVHSPQDEQVPSLPTIGILATPEKALLVEAALKREGIQVLFVGGQGYDICVPRHLSRKAVTILKEDARKNGYDIIWRTP